MNIIRDIEQGSEEWHKLRIGQITASKFKDVMSGGKGITRKKYMMSLAAEILTGERADFYQNSAMEWGTETEPKAKAMYEFDTGFDVEEVTFIQLGEGFIIGASPDGLIGENGGIEIKCPNTTTQIETVLSNKMPAQHKPQVQGCLWVSGREWWDFVSFDPRISGKASFFCERQFRDEDYIKSLKSECLKFQEELFSMVEKLKG